MYDLTSTERTIIDENGGTDKTIMPMKRILQKLELNNLTPAFESEKIEISNYLSLIEEQVIR